MGSPASEFADRGSAVSRLAVSNHMHERAEFDFPASLLTNSRVLVASLTRESMAAAQQIPSKRASISTRHLFPTITVILGRVEGNQRRLFRELTNYRAQT